jgi:hypothetical protein
VTVVLERLERVRNSSVRIVASPSCYPSGQLYLFFFCPEIILWKIQLKQRDPDLPSLTPSICAIICLSVINSQYW